MKRFKNSTFLCSYFCEETQTKNEVYITSLNRYEAYKELCKIYPISKGGIFLYSQRLVISEI
jgi:hypothetical protein